jgi:hypothetical protein
MAYTESQIIASLDGKAEIPFSMGHVYVYNFTLNKHHSLFLLLQHNNEAIESAGQVTQAAAATSGSLNMPLFLYPSTCGWASGLWVCKYIFLNTIDKELGSKRTPHVELRSTREKV